MACAMPPSPVDVLIRKEEHVTIPVASYEGSPAPRYHLLATLVGHRKAVASVKWSPDGEMCACYQVGYIGPH